jgi:UDP-glucose:(heptosyl)LPS alpha-1,3-glucosyltransferase
MRIALVILHADAARGGAERYTIDLAAALAARGHEVEVIATTIRQLPPDVRGVQLMSRRPTRTWTYRAFVRMLDSHLVRHPYDVVHAMLPVRRCDVYHPHAGLAAAAVAEAPFIERLFNPRRGAMARIERRLMQQQRPPIVLSLSNYVGQAIKQHYPDARVETLFNAVDLDRFQPRPLPAPGDTVQALIVAQDFHRKGVGEAIAALAKADGIDLTVVGGGDARPYIATAEKAGVAHRIRFAGRVADPRPHFANADFFVLPTKHDPCSLVVLESLAMGVPVITTRLNGAAEIMREAVHGYILDDPLDVDALAAAMRKMLDGDRRAQMSQACLALRPALSYEQHLDRLLAIYQRWTVDSPALAGQAS